MQRPFVKHVGKSYGANFTMRGAALAIFGGELVQRFQVGVALLLETVECVLRVGGGVHVEVELRIVGLKFRIVLGEETVQARPVAVAFGMRKMRQHFAHGKKAASLS